MVKPLLERDWKYLGRIKNELLATLCRRINQEAIKIIQSKKASEHDKYLSLYRHIMDSNGVIAECFDDWRRSSLMLRIVALYRHDLLTEEHINNLSDDTRIYLDTLLSIKNRGADPGA